MKRAFSRCHPAVNFIFFLLAIGATVVVQHPAFLLASILAAAVYYLLLRGVRALKTMAALLPLFVLATVVNPVFNTEGEHVLFLLFGRPYTLEALIYGAVVAGMLVSTMLWCGCYNAVMSGEKFVFLFGRIMPSLSLILVMLFRLVPGFTKKAAQITTARKSLHLQHKPLREGMGVISGLTSWALEGGITTSDSMVSRGYGAGRRSNYRKYRFTVRDGILLTSLLALAAAAFILGDTAAAFTPVLTVAPLQGANLWAISAYSLMLLLPVFYEGKEALSWQISRSGI